MSSSYPPESSPIPSRESAPPPRRRWPIGRWLLTLLVIAAVYVGFTLLNSTSHAQFQWAAALEALDEGNIVEAQKHADQALKLDPEDSDLQLRAAEFFYRIDQPEVASKHLKRALELSGDNPTVLNTASFLFARMGKHDQSLPLSDKLVDLSETKRTIHPHMALNQRAYAIALAAADGQASDEQIQQGLEDINKALEVFVHDDAVIDQRIANYLDTRGYLELYAGSPQRGLKDINKAIAVYELLREEIAKEVKDANLDKVPEAAIAFDQELKHVLAVLFAHRAAILEELNEADAADADHIRASEFGLNRKKGIW